MPAPPPRHLRARPRRLSTPLRWLLSLALLTPLVAGVAGIAGVAETPAAGAAPGSPAAVAVRFALAQLGKPYRWGADGPESFDCSGLVQTSYKAAGIGLPRVSRQQYGAGRQVSLKALRAGDLLFYAKDTGDRRTIYHVGRYLGSGRMVEAPNRRPPAHPSQMLGIPPAMAQALLSSGGGSQSGLPPHGSGTTLSSAACENVPAASWSSTPCRPTGSRRPSASPGRASWPCWTRSTTAGPG